MLQSVHGESPVLLRIPEVMRLAGLGRTTVYQEINAGRLRTRRFGRAVRVHRDDFEAWASAGQRQRGKRAA